jgi:hypothetical protein
MDRWLGSPQDQSGTHGEEKILPLAGLKQQSLSLPASSQSPYQCDIPALSVFSEEHELLTLSDDYKL